MTSTPCQVLRGYNHRFAVVVQEAIASHPSLFEEFFDSTPTTFVDKSLVLEAFLRDTRSHHLILRPRRCGKSFTTSMIREFLERPWLGPHVDITRSKFRATLIATEPYRDLVNKHFRRYPVLYINLKDIKGLTYEQMLDDFDHLIRIELFAREALFHDGIIGQDHIKCYKDMLQHPRSWSTTALQCLSKALKSAYKQDVVVLIDEYDAPIHSAIENGYAKEAGTFFAKVFGSLLKDNNALSCCMMVGICQTAKSGWLSELNNFEVFPLHARDTRYADFFLLTEEEVGLLCEEYGSQELNISVLREHYNGYTARGASGPVKLFNPLSVIRALEKHDISPYWVETGRYSFLTQNLWRASVDFRAKFNLLMTQETVQLEMDEHTNYETVGTITDRGLWGLLYHTGYLTVHDYKDLPLSGYSFRIPNLEITLQWHQWVKDYLGDKLQSSLFDLREILMNGNARAFQGRFTTFLQENLSLFCAPHHREKVYQALCFLLIFLLFDNSHYGYQVTMEQEGGHGRSDITAYPRANNYEESLIFEIKAVSRHRRIRNKRVPKSLPELKKDLEKAAAGALKQIEDRQYRARAPPHSTKLHEYGIAFTGKFCVAAVRTFLRSSETGDWEEVNHADVVIPKKIRKLVLIGGDGDGDTMVLD